MTDPRPICFLDCETLGLDPEAPIWEFAAVTVFPDGNEDPTRFCIRHDQDDWLETLPLAFQDDYRTRYEHREALDEGDAALLINMVTNNAIIVGCNPGFDIERLTKLLLRNGIEPAWHYHPLDIASVAIGFLAGRGFPPRQPWKSDMLANGVGVDTGQFPRHTAKGDVDWTRAQWNNMIGANHLIGDDRPSLATAARMMQDEAQR